MLGPHRGSRETFGSLPLFTPRTTTDGSVSKTLCNFPSVAAESSSSFQSLLNPPLQALISHPGLQHPFLRRVASSRPPPVNSLDSMSSSNRCQVASLPLTAQPGGERSAPSSRGNMWSFCGAPLSGTPSAHVRCHPRGLAPLPSFLPPGLLPLRPDVLGVVTTAKCMMASPHFSAEFACRPGDFLLP